MAALDAGYRVVSVADGIDGLLEGVEAGALEGGTGIGTSWVSLLSATHLPALGASANASRIFYAGHRFKSMLFPPG
jgi:hypothetical protein